MGKVAGIGCVQMLLTLGGLGGLSCMARDSDVANKGCGHQSGGNLWHHPDLNSMSGQGLSLCSPYMGSVAHNILHVPSRGAMDCVLEENFQVSFELFHDPTFSMK